MHEMVFLGMNPALISYATLEYSLFLILGKWFEIESQCWLGLVKATL